MVRNNEVKKRCPNCNSANIYRRCRETRNTIRYKRSKKIEVKIKKRYMCRSCRYEFDVPFELLKL